jgi:hypothetical protein
MADQPGTLQSLGAALTAALRPLTTAFNGTEQFKAFMLRLGWQPTDIPPEYTSLASTVSAAIDKLEALGDPPTSSICCRRRSPPSTPCARFPRHRPASMRERFWPRSASGCSRSC